MRFLDITTGHTFDALWEDGQTNGYTFWFPNEQSVNLTYVTPICMLTDTAEPISLSLEENDVFSFVTASVETTFDGFSFREPTYSYTVETDVERISESVYAHKVYIAASSKTNGQCTTFVDVSGHGRIRVGADFYGENESLYINLSNNGVEIPESVQKTIYDANVHEDYKDNILINRKFKELMSNYWDVVANKGSYKSLINSLKWFEWGDVLAIREMWKRDVVDRPIYEDREMCSIFEDRYIDTMDEFKRTTYISLYANTDRDTDSYDSEHNPIIEEVALKWTKEDLSLKMSLLAEFFGTFFMPIHLSIFHACVEDRVYTNTIKAMNGCVTSRTDQFGCYDCVECNIKDGAVFRIDNVRAQVTEDTVFGVTTEMDTTHTHFGVDTFPSQGVVSENSLPTFASQYYTGPGVIIPVRFTINNTGAREFLKYTSVAFTPDNMTHKDTIVCNRVVYSKGNKIEFNFNILSKAAREYDMVFTFVLGSSKTLTRRLTFSTIDVDNLNLSIYRVISKDDGNGFSYEDFYTTDMNDLYFKIQKVNPMTYHQYLPYMENPTADYRGVRLNRTIVIDVRETLAYEISRLRLKLAGYLLFDRTGEDGSVRYIIAVSKRFNESTPDGVIGHYKVIRNDLGFYPQFHTLERIGGNTIEDYTISQYDALCVIPEIHKWGNTYERFRYGHLIESSEWEFVNRSQNLVTTHPSSARVPFISSNNGKILDDGFYDIVFRYRMGGDDRELRLDSAFRKKTV